MTPSDPRCVIETYQLTLSAPVSAATQASCGTAADSVACKAISFLLTTAQTITATYTIGIDGGNVIPYKVQLDV